MKHYYVICSHCGANLDPGEKCECQRSEKVALKVRNNADSNRSSVVGMCSTFKSFRGSSKVRNL